MTDSLIDFDAFRAEQERVTLPVKVGGVTYQVPASPPAAAVFDSMRRRRTGQTKVPPAEIENLARGILGDAAEPIIREAGLTLPELMALVELVAERQAAAIMPPPNRAARRTRPPRTRSTSSKAGRSSRQTSNASTGSTSGQASRA